MIPNGTSDFTYTTPLMMAVTNGTEVAPPREVWVAVLQTVALSLTTFLVITGNVLCFQVLLRTRRDGGEVTRLCLLCLTASDTAIGLLICVPITGATAVDRWPYGDAFCTLTAGSTVLVSLNGLFLVVVNLERYVAIVWPLRSAAWVTTGRTKALLAAVWVLGGAFAVAYCFFPGRRAAYYPHLHTCFVDPEDPDKPDPFGVFAALIFAVLPFLMTLLLYLRLCQIARRHVRRINDQGVYHHPQQQQQGGRRGIRKSDLKTVTTFVIITAVLGVCWLPFSVIISYENVTRRRVNGALSFVAELLLLSNSYLNLVVYYARNQSFRRAGIRFVRGCVRGGGRSRRNELQASRSVEGTSSVFAVSKGQTGVPSMPSIG